MTESSHISNKKFFLLLIAVVCITVTTVTLLSLRHPKIHQSTITSPATATAPSFFQIKTTERVVPKKHATQNETPESNNQLYQVLSTLGETLSTLAPVAPTTAPSALQITPVTAEDSWFQKIVKIILRELSKFIIIQPNSENIQSLSTSTQIDFLHNQFQLLIAQAQWAALQQNTYVYLSSLSQIQTLLKKYFSNNINDFQTINNQLTVLMATPIAPNHSNSGAR